MNYHSAKAAAWLGAALLLAQAGVAAVSLFRPRVDPFYASYYITNQRHCWLPPEAAVAARTKLRLPTIEVAKLPPRLACYLLAAGWSDVETWGVWSNRRFAEVDLPVAPGRSRLSLTVIGFSPRNRQSVRIWINGTSAGAWFVPTGSLSRINLRVPGGTVDLRITFLIKHPARPGPSDTRALGIGLVVLRWS